MHRNDEEEVKNEDKDEGGGLGYKWRLSWLNKPGLSLLLGKVPIKGRKNKTEPQHIQSSLLYLDKKYVYQLILKIKSN